MLSRKPQCRTDLVLVLFVEVVPSKNRPVAFRRQLVEQPPDNRVLLILQQAVEWPGRRIPHITCVVARRGLTGLRSPCMLDDQVSGEAGHKTREPFRVAHRPRTNLLDRHAERLLDEIVTRGTIAGGVTDDDADAAQVSLYELLFGLTIAGSNARDKLGQRHA